MKLETTDRDRITHFHHSGKLPPEAIYTRALALIGESEPLATFLERFDEAGRTAVTVWILLPKTIIRVYGVGPGGWDDPTYRDPDEVHADLWPLKFLDGISVKQIDRLGGDSGGVSWRAQLTFVIDGQQLVIPSSTADENWFDQSRLDSFLASTVTAING